MNTRTSDKLIERFGEITMAEGEGSGFLSKIKAMIERDKTVRLVANNPELTGEFLLLFRMILADGQVRGRELEMLKRICSDEFGINPESMDGVYKYLEDYAYETTSAQSASLFKSLPVERRQQLLDHMIAIAEADGELVSSELKLLDRTASMLGFDLKSEA